MESIEYNDHLYISDSDDDKDQITLHKAAHKTAKFDKNANKEAIKQLTM